MKMKKYSIVLLIVLALTLVAITFPTFAVAEDVIYVKDGGTGNGATPETAMGDLFAAINALPADGGTVVVCGDLTLAPGGTQVYTWTAKTGKVTVTGKYNGQNYNPTVNFSGTGKVVFDCASEIEFDNIHFKYLRGSSMEFWSGPSLTMGLNVTYSNKGETIQPSQNGIICFRMGNYNASCTSSELEIFSGTISYVQAGNNKASNVVGTSTITLHPNVTVTDFVQCGGTQNGRTTNSTVNINGADVGYVYAGGYGNTVTGNVSLNIQNVQLKALYGQRSSTFQGVGTTGSITNNLNLTLDNVTVETWNIEGLTVEGQQNLTVRNASLLKTNNSLSGWDSLKLENSTVWVDAAYAGPATFTADNKSLLIVDDATAAIPEGAYAESKAVVTLDPSGEVNTFAAAYAKLAENNAPGGVVILSGDLKLSFSGQNSWPTATGPVTITSVNDAMLTLENTSTVATQVIFRSVTKFCDIHLNEVNTGGDNHAVELWAASDLTFGEGIRCTINGTTNIATTRGQFSDGRICVRIGDRSANGASGSFTMHSGALSWILGGNNKKTVVTANIYVGKGATVVDFVQAGGVAGYTVSTSNVTLEYADVYALFLGGHGTTTTGDVKAEVIGTDLTYLYGQRNGTTVSAGTKAGTVASLKLTLDNATVENTDLSQLTITNDAKLTYKNCDTIIAHGDLSYWDSLTLDNAIIYVAASEYKGPAVVTADADSAILVDKDIYTELPTIEGVRVAFCEQGHIHNLVYTPAKAPGSLLAGNNAYYHCAECGNYYADANAKTELDYEKDIYLAPTGGGPVHHNYTDGNNFSLETLLPGGSSQGVAVHGDILFKANNRGACSVWDLTTGQQIGSFNFGSATSSGGDAWSNHANSIMFGAEKFDESDPFPLLYVCAGNSGDHITDGQYFGTDTVGSYYGHLAIERIFYDETTGKYSAETIQRVFFNDMANIPVVEGDDLQGNKLSTMRDPVTGALYYTSGNGYDAAKGYQKIGWGWPAWFVDSDPTSDTFGKIFIFSVRYRTYSSYEGTMRSFYGLGADWNYFLEDGTGNAYILTEVDMPALPTSEEDASYGKNVILYPKDIKDQFTTRYTNGGTQGGTMYQGRLYYSYGFGAAASNRHSRNYINVIDIAKKDIVAEVPLCNDPTTRSHEPECPAIWRGELIISMNPGVYSIGYIALDEPTTKDGLTYIECSLCGHKLKTLHTTNPSLGDANCDGTVTAEDANLVKQYRAGLVESSAIELTVCDLDGNDKVDAYDAYLIQLYAAGRITEFPCQNESPQ